MVRAKISSSTGTRTLSPSPETSCATTQNEAANKATDANNVLSKFFIPKRNACSELIIALFLLEALGLDGCTKLGIELVAHGNKG